MLKYRLLLVGKPEGKRPLGRPRRRWEDGIGMGLGKTGWGVWSGFNWPVAGCCKCDDKISDLFTHNLSIILITS
jgi:hypothetical protein